MSIINIGYNIDNYEFAFNRFERHTCIDLDRKMRVYRMVTN